MPLTVENVGMTPENILTAELVPPPPFDFNRSLHSLKDSGANDQTDVLDLEFNWLERPLKLNGKVFLVHLENLGPDEDHPRLRLTLQAEDNATEPPGENDLAAAVKWADRRFCLGVDLEAIRQAISVDAYGEELVAMFWPARPTNLGGAWEGLLKTVISNQIYPGLAVRLQQGLLAFYGDPVHFGGKEYRLFPSIEKLAEILPDDLLGMRFSRQKAAYLPGMAGTILAKPERYDFERLRTLPGTEAVAILDELPGVGPWTANYIAMRGLSHPDIFIDEAGLRRTLAAAYNRGENLTNDDFARITALFAPYRSFACYYSYMKMYNV